MVGAVVAACLSVQVCYHCVITMTQHITIMQGEAVLLLSYLGLGWSMGVQGRSWGEQYTGNGGWVVEISSLISSDSTALRTQ